MINSPEMNKTKITVTLEAYENFCINQGAVSFTNKTGRAMARMTAVVAVTLPARMS